MARNTMQDLHNGLFGLFEDLCDKEVNGEDIDKEKVTLAIGVAKTIIDAGRAEVDFIKTMADMPAGKTGYVHTTKLLSGGNI